MLERITNDSIVHEVNEEQINENTDGYINYSERPETYIVPVVFGIIFLVGVIGNGCLIYILCRHKTMRSVPNTFIFNLALGDLLVLVFSVPFTSTIYTIDSWPYGEFVCKASEFAKVYNELLKNFCFVCFFSSVYLGYAAEYVMLDAGGLVAKLPVSIFENHFGMKSHSTSPKLVNNVDYVEKSGRLGTHLRHGWFIDVRFKSWKTNSLKF